MTRNLRAALRAAKIDLRTAYPETLAEIITQRRNAVVYMTYWSPAEDAEGNLWVPNTPLDPSRVSRGGTLQVRVTVVAGHVTVDIPRRHLHEIRRVTDTTGWVAADEITFTGRD